VPKKIALDTDAFAQAMQQARKELGPKALVKDVIARRDEILGGRPVTGDIGEQSRQANPEPTRAETKSAQLASPGATEVKATSRTSRGTANTAASEQSQPEPRTPPPPGESTAVDSFKYDADKQEIHVVGKNGRTYVYGEVTPEQAQMFHEAESKGMAWKAIKDNNPYVAKIIDGKRTAIRRGPTSANPDDLTPQLEESLKQALRKKR
jgi:hypothetical protein